MTCAHCSKKAITHHNNRIICLYHSIKLDELNEDILYVNEVFKTEEEKEVSSKYKALLDKENTFEELQIILLSFKVDEEVIKKQNKLYHDIT